VLYWITGEREKEIYTIYIYEKCRCLSDAAKMHFVN